MFNYPATELFRGEDRRVVWSAEEYDSAMADGWSAERPVVDAPPAVEARPTKAKKQPKPSAE